MSDDYARQTAYGEVIVFGILGAFASLGKLRDRPGLKLAKVSPVYRSPLYLNVDYLVSVDERSEDYASVDLFDGVGVAMMSSNFRFRTASGQAAAGEVAGICPLSEQAEWKAEDLHQGSSRGPTYRRELVTAREKSFGEPEI